MTHSSYQGECFVWRGEAFDQMGLYRDYLERDPRTAGLQIYLSSVPTLIRTSRAYKSRK